MLFLFQYAVLPGLLMSTTTATASATSTSIAASTRMTTSMGDGSQGPCHWALDTQNKKANLSEFPFSAELETCFVWITLFERVDFHLR